MRFDLQKEWYRPSLTIFSFLLLPFSFLFFLIVTFRKFLFKIGVKKSFKLPVPVIVVGNITVGGTGKTPCVVWVAHVLKKHGYKPGIISRAGGKINKKPVWIDQSTDVKQVGDEAILLFRKAMCPLVVCLQRIKAAELLLKHTTCNIIISDDGLQHYALQRDCEIIMVDGDRQFGNRYMLPAGPLREPISRLNTADFVITQVNELAHANEMMLVGENIIQLKSKQEKQLIDFKKTAFHAVAAIGNPSRFFEKCKKYNNNIMKHIFPDHYIFKASDFAFNDNLPIIMTEKDAVKCKDFADERFWFLPVEAHMSENVEKILMKKIHSLFKE